MSKLLIVESPAKAKTIGKYVGDGFDVRASVGHVRDLPKSNKTAIDIEAGFVPNYEIVKGKEKVLHEIEQLAKKADEILLATDPDREGEAIAWHLFEALKLSKSKTKRVVFHEITKDAVLEALTHPRAIDEHLRRAQEARRVLDRLVGYDLSGLIWKKVRYGLSAGRVQSPALRIIMEREREIRAFIPEDFWVITAEVADKKNEPFVLTCSVEPKTQEETDKILALGKQGPWVVKDVKESEQKRSPYPPFTTSTLQQAASTRLGYSPSKTMHLAQKLYEAGHITYMRTDSVTLSKQALSQITLVVEKEFGKEYAQVRTYKTKSKSAQEAHEAIRPTSVTKASAGTTEEQKRLYKLIWTRAVASQMSDAKLMKSKMLVDVANSKAPDFGINGSRVLFPGWLKADTAARGEEYELPKVEVGEKLLFKDIHALAKQTQPPNRYTEAGLIKELEKRGIGRPSTYASIIKTLADREYVTKEGRTLFPTDTGDVVSSFLESNFAGYISDDFTAEMENELDEIAEGKREYEKTLRDFYSVFLKDIKSKESIDKLTNLGPVSNEFLCPLCGKEMIYKLGRGGKFMSCSTFPECSGARKVDGSVLEPDKPIGAHPETGEDIYVLDGRFGPYVQVGKPEPKSAKKTTKKRGAKKEKPKRASIPKDVDPTAISLDDALKFLSLPRVLGTHTETGEEIVAGVGRFGPFIVHQGDFRSLKTDSVYDIQLPRALEILAEPKRKGRARNVAANKSTEKRKVKKEAS